MKSFLRARIKRYMRDRLIYVSLMFVAINPMAENEDDRTHEETYPQAQYYQAGVIQGGGSFGSNNSVEQKVFDYYKLGSLYKMQGQVKDSYKAFLMGENLDDMGSVTSGAVASPSSVLFSNNQPVALQENSLNDYLQGLIRLYLQRVEILSQNYDYLQEAENELRKVFIIDPLNDRAKELQKRIDIKKEEREKIKPVAPRETQKTLIEEASREENTIQQPPVQQKLMVEKVGTAPVLADKNETFVSEKDAALRAAQNSLSQAILSQPELEKTERVIKEKYEAGKRSLKTGEYYEAIMAFKKVLALAPDHLYSKYARQFIEIATEKIREREEADLRIVTETKTTPVVVESQPVFQQKEAVVKPEEEIVTIPMRETTEMRKNAILQSQIENVLASIRRFMKEGRYERVHENLTALLTIDPNNEEALLLRNEYNKIIEKQLEEKRSQDRIKRIKDEEQWRAQYFARQTRRREARARIERKYKKWTETSNSLRDALFSQKVYEKISDARLAYQAKDYFRTREALNALFILEPAHTEGRRIERAMENDIREMSSLLACKRMPIDTLEKEQTELSPDDSDVRLTESFAEESRVIAADKESSGKTNSNALFQAISEYQPFTVLAEREKKSQAQTTAQIMETPQTKVDGIKTNLSEKEKTSKTASIDKTENTQISQSVITSQEQHKELDSDTEKVISLSQDEKERIEKYLSRGRRHFRQGNYPLALVVFKKVQEWDLTKQYAKEVDSLIKKTEEILSN